MRLLREAKSRGVPISGEACCHHFTLTDAAIAGSEKFWAADGKEIFGYHDGGYARPSWPSYDTHFKMNPPLREAVDRDAMLQGIADGSVDVIATDHAPHHYDEKHVEFDQAPFGITGLETAVSLCFDRLVHAGVISLSRLIELLSVNPARVINVPGGTLSEGAPADVSLLLPDLQVTVSAASMRSKSKNTPFDGWSLRGGVGATIVGGRVVYVNGNANLAL